MVGIGGNATASVMRAVKAKDASGRAVAGKYEKLMDLTGWLDYQSGQKGHEAHQAEVAETTHIFISGYDAAFAALKTAGLSLDIGGRRYEVLLIDDPMGMHSHLETYLKHVGDA